MTTITYLNTIHVQYSLRSVLAHRPQHACLRCISIQHGVLLLSHISKSYETRINASSASVNTGFPKLFFNTFYSEKNTLTSSSETVGTASEISECRHTGPHVYYGVTYILTANNDANVGTKFNFKADIEFPQGTRSAQMLM